MPDPALPERAALHARSGRLVPAGRVLASWQRSEEYGVPLDEVEPSFTGTVDDGSLFSVCGAEVLAQLGGTLAAEPVSLMLADADGVVLRRYCGDHALLRALDTVHLAPGFGYSEREVGTNGLGLALADRSPTLVRAEEHYAVSLTGYTCAAAPVLDPVTGRVEGSVNLTTWSRSSSDLLLALAQSAAGNTAALMLSRRQGRRPRPNPRGTVFRVETGHLEPGAGTLRDLSVPWAACLAACTTALDQGRVVAAVGERGSGRATILAQAARAGRPHERILAARTPAPQDVDAWLSLWTPELAKPHTAVIVCDADALPAWVAERLRDLLLAARRTCGALPFAFTAQRLEDVPGALAGLASAVVTVPALRDRPDDVLPLARHAARRVRGREVDFTPAAEHALRDHPWRGNVEQLQRVVAGAARSADVIDVRHLPAELLSAPTHRLSRIESFERDEIVRALAVPGITMKDAASRLGMSRATLYRKVAQYGVRPRG